MDDTLKNLTLGFFALLTLHGSLEKRAQRAAANQMRQVFHNTGSLTARVESRGMFGLLANDLWSVDITGQGQTIDRLPLMRYPHPGWKGRIRHLRLHLTALTLGGLPIDRMDADIPFVKYDLGQAVYKDRLVIRSAGIGPASVRVGDSGLEKFVLRKYKETLSDVIVNITPNHLVLSGNVKLFTGVSNFVATGRLMPRGGRYVDLVDPVVQLNGQSVSPRVAAIILEQINPVLDADVDLHLSGFFSVKRLELGVGELTIYGDASLPEVARTLQ